MFPRLTTALLICIFFSFLTPLRSEQIVLKSGKTLTGSIVDYDEHMFRVETEFGFALIRKDRVASINFDSAEAPASTSRNNDEQGRNEKPETGRGPNSLVKPDTARRAGETSASEKAAPTHAAATLPESPPEKIETADSPAVGTAGAMVDQSPAPEPVASGDPMSPISPPESESGAEIAPIVADSFPVSAEPEKVMPAEAATGAVRLETAQADSENSQELVPKQSQAEKVIAAVEVAAAEAEEPPRVPEGPVDPSEMVERVVGNLYVNETFRFAMYKPPNWVLFRDVRKASATSVIAMGTEDERILLFVERESSVADPENHGGIEATLRQTYREYRVLGEENVTVDGRAGVRRRFFGVLDGIDWYGMAVHVSDDYGEFGIIGLTCAETFQFKQAVFNKIVRTFRFTTP